jgi:integrase
VGTEKNETKKVTRTGNAGAAGDVPPMVKKKRNDPLTDLQVRAFVTAHARARKGGAAAIKETLGDSHGLMLGMTQGGMPVWRVRYRYAGKERVYTIGRYEADGAGGDEAAAFSLKAARAERDKVRAWLAQGLDPVQQRRLVRATNVVASGETFEEVARAWLKKQHREWSAVHFRKSQRAFERDIFPKIGALPVVQITPALIANVIDKIQSRPGAPIETAHRILQHVRSVFQFARAQGKCAANPAEPVTEILAKPRPARSHPAYLKWPELGTVLRHAERAHLTREARMAHRLCAFTAARIANVVQARWEEFDLDADAPVWTIARENMKAKSGRRPAHKIFLGPTIAEELREWKSLGSGKGYLFPSPVKGKHSHIARETIEKDYRVTLGLRDKHSPHGWRSALSTLAREDGDFDRDVVELALDHIHDNEVVRAYDRGERLQRRIQLARWWDEQLTKAQRGEAEPASATVVPIRDKRAA